MNHARHYPWLCLLAAAAACSGPTRTETFTISQPVRELRAFTGAGDVTVRAAPVKAVTVTAVIEGEDSAVLRDLADGVLTLEPDCSGFLWSLCAIDYDIEIPELTAVTAETGSGNIALHDVARDAALETGSGDVRIVGFSGETLGADTGSGDIRIDGFTGASLDLDTGSGSITGTDLAALTAGASTGSGDVGFDFVEPPTTVVIDTGSGDVRVSVPPGVYHVDADTGSGDVTVDGITMDSDAPALISIDTGSGDVDVLGR